VHSVFSSTDLQSGPLLYLALACIAAVTGALAWRVARSRAAVPRAGRVPELMDDQYLLARAGDR